MKKNMGQNIEADVIMFFMGLSRIDDNFDFFFRGEFTNAIQPSVASSFIWIGYTFEISGLKSFWPSMMGPSVSTNQR